MFLLVTVKKRPCAWTFWSRPWSCCKLQRWCTASTTRRCDRFLPNNNNNNNLLMKVWDFETCKFETLVSFVREWSFIHWWRGIVQPHMGLLQFTVVYFFGHGEKHGSVRLQNATIRELVILQSVPSVPKVSPQQTVFPAGSTPRRKLLLPDRRPKCSLVNGICYHMLPLFPLVCGFECFWLGTEWSPRCGWLLEALRDMLHSTAFQVHGKMARAWENSESREKSGPEKHQKIGWPTQGGSERLRFTSHLCRKSGAKTCQGAT